MREFSTGATRDDEEGKLDYEGALSPLVLKRYVEYMDKHCTQADGKPRSADNWQKGIPIRAYMKAKWRHFMTTWLIWRVHLAGDMTESLCAELFNTMGILHELLKDDDTSGEFTVDSGKLRVPTIETLVNQKDVWHCKKHNTYGPSEEPCWQCENEKDENA